ncbi:putative serine esterase-domain-containing protein [Zopfochytrium polystomum]|nr:putative serine esterase-domain-containing protein [Zopfochytrium polystomum]
MSSRPKTPPPTASAAAAADVQNDDDGRPANPSAAPPSPYLASSVHLFVLHNGLWGNSGHLTWLGEQITAHFSQYKDGAGGSTLAVEVLNYSSNEWIRTYDGLDECGGRLAHAVIARIQDHDRPPVSHISIIGYSLGGLIVRYAIGVLWAHGYLRRSVGSPSSTHPTTTDSSHIVPEAVHFCTFASPHLGSARDSGSSFDMVFNNLGAGLTGRTGAQMLRKDGHWKKWPLARWTSKDIPELWLGGRPILDILADPELPFWKGLSVFASRTLYGNIRYDFLVPLPTSCILQNNPYLDLALTDPAALASLDPSDPLQSIPLQSQQATSLLQNSLLYRVVNPQYPSIVEPNPDFAGSSPVSPAAADVNPQTGSPIDELPSNTKDDASNSAPEPQLSVSARIRQALPFPFFAVIGVTSLSGMWLLWQISRTSILISAAVVPPKPIQHASIWTSTRSVQESLARRRASKMQVVPPVDSSSPPPPPAPPASSSSTSSSSSSTSPFSANSTATSAELTTNDGGQGERGTGTNQHEDSEAMDLDIAAGAVEGLRGGLAWVEAWAVRRYRRLGCVGGSGTTTDGRSAERVAGRNGGPAGDRVFTAEYARTALDRLGWQRYHVLSDQRRSHATIVKRSPRFVGNEDVVQHFLDQVVG